MDFTSAYQNEPRRAVFCMDAKSFYASVECVERGLDPLETLLIVMSGNPQKSGLVLAASPRAKKELGISNVSRANAVPNHPNLWVVPPRMRLYIQYQMKILEIFRQYMADEDIHVYSIDEMFGELTKSWRLFGTSPEAVAKKIQQQVYQELSLYVTIGLSDNLLLAKVAMDVEAKKNSQRFALWHYEDVPQKLWPLELTEMWGINQKMALRFKKMGIDSIGGLAHYNPFLLKERLGVMGLQHYMHAWGIDRSQISKKSEYQVKSKSIGNSQVLMRNYVTRSEIITVLAEICEQVCQRMRKAGVVGATLHLSVGFGIGEGGGFSRQMKIDPTNQAKIITRQAIFLFDKYWDHQIVRNLGVTMGSLAPSGNLQLNLFEDPEKTMKEDALDDVIAKIRARYDFTAIVRAHSLLEGATAISRSNLVGGHAGGLDGL